MTRSKIFLGLTTCCLAIAGAVAAKVTHFGSHSFKYFTTGSTCVTGTTFPCVRDLNASRTCIYDYSSPTVTKKTAVYTIVNDCQFLLKYSKD